MSDNGSYGDFLSKESISPGILRLHPTLLESLLLLLLTYVIYLNYFLPKQQQTGRNASKTKTAAETDTDEDAVSTDAITVRERLMMHENLILRIFECQTILRDNLGSLQEDFNSLQTDFETLKSGFNDRGMSHFPWGKSSLQTKNTSDKGPNNSPTQSDCTPQGLSVNSHNKEKVKLMDKHDPDCSSSTISVPKSRIDTNMLSASSQTPKHGDGEGKRSRKQSQPIKDKEKNNVMNSNRHTPQISAKGTQEARSQTRTTSSNHEHRPPSDDDLHNPKEDNPKVLFVHDSIFKYTKVERLKTAYSLNTKKCLAYNIQDATKIIDEECSKCKYDAIYIHTGINDLKYENPRIVADKMSSLVTSLKSKYPDTKVVVSRIAPTLIPELENKRSIYNSLLVSKLYGSKNIFLQNHENLWRYNIHRDGIHPRPEGTMILTKNAGRCLHGLFFEMGTRQSRQLQKQWWSAYITSY